jgi:hypothetical protein
MAGNRRNINDRYLDPNSWLGKLILSEATDGKRRLDAHCGSARIKPGKKVEEDLSFGGYSVKELRKRGVIK